MSYDVIWDSLRKGSTTANAGLEMQQGTAGKGKNKLTFPVLQVSQDPFCGLAQLPQYVRPIYVQFSFQFWFILIAYT